MTALRVHTFTVSIDGFGAGVDQDADHPIGIGGEQLHHWLFRTALFGERMGTGEGSDGIDDAQARRGTIGVGATIMGRNMFGPVRGRWEDSEEWMGWWGDEPPFHHPVFVLTHEAREPLVVGETTFYFVTGGIEEARERAIEAANGLDVTVGGGVSTVQQFMRAGLVDEVNLAFVPALLGRGERLFEGVDAVAAGYEYAETITGEGVTHIRLVRASST